MNNLDNKYFKKMVMALDNDDFEGGHGACDDVLEELLIELKMFKTLEHYNKQGKWYS